MPLRTGHQLRVARVAAGMTQTDLAEACFIHRNSVHQREQLAILPDTEAVRLMTAVLLESGVVTLDDDGTLTVRITDTWPI